MVAALDGQDGCPRPLEGFQDLGMLVSYIPLALRVSLGIDSETVGLFKQLYSRRARVCLLLAVEDVVGWLQARIARAAKGCKKWTVSLNNGARIWAL